MIYITGDCHGDFTRFSNRNFPEQKEMIKDDFVIILGDFGYWDNTKESINTRKWLNDKPFTTLWINGNHENFDMLKELPVEEWHGGKVQYIEDSIIHLMRGEIYDIAGFTFFTFGGARSHDIQDGILEPDDPDFKKKCRALNERAAAYRVNHLSWWKEEMPIPEEMEYGLKNLETHGNAVDFILSHDGPHKAMNLIYPGWIEKNELNTFFDDLSERISFKKWFFGHHHDNRIIDRDYILLYEQIIPLIV